MSLERPLHVLALSAVDEAALRARAGRLAAALSGNEPVADLCFTINTSGALGPARAAVACETLAELREALAALGRGESPAAASVGTATSAPKVAFLFTGQGSQYAGMGRPLYDSSPRFRQELDACAAVLAPLLERPLLEVLYPAEGAPTPIDDTAYAQPCLFALEYALAQLWRSFGVEPVALLGHSVGEYVAMTLAGVLSRDEGLRLIAERGRLMQALPKDGAMLAVQTDEARVRAALAPHIATLSLAAANGPTSYVVSGATAAIEAVAGELGGAGVKTTRLTVSHAFHSPLMEPMLEPFERFAAGLRLAPAQVPIASNVTGDLLPAGFTPDAAYFKRHVRGAVLFAPGMQALAAAGCDAYVEVGPSPTLIAMAKPFMPRTAGFHPSLKKRAGDGWNQLLESLRGLWVRGGSVDWRAFDAAYPRTPVALPKDVLSG